MKPVQDHGTVGSKLHAPPLLSSEAGENSSCSEELAPPRRPARSVQAESWTQRSQRLGRLMMEARSGDGHAYEQLLRELDAWLCRYYARRLPHPAAEDARQNTLLAIHAKRHTYAPSRPFGAWVSAIARYKWIDRIRDASRFSALSLDDDIAIEDHGEAAISAATMDDLL